MDENIIIAAYHEAGHSILAYIVSWTIQSASLTVRDNHLVDARTSYNFGNDDLNDDVNLRRRIYCLMGGPVSESLYRNENEINLDFLGIDGVLIDQLLNHYPLWEKEQLIEETLEAVATFMSMNSVLSARQEISQVLQENHTISNNEFEEIITRFNVPRINFE